MQQPLIDDNGWKYFPSLPQGWSLATLDDFHIKRKLKFGMEYLIKWDAREYYELRIVTPDLAGKWLLPFIEVERVFIQKG
jgi:hypothetical protein